MSIVAQILVGKELVGPKVYNFIYLLMYTLYWLSKDFWSDFPDVQVYDVITTINLSSHV